VIGPVYIASLFALTAVVVAVYSLAQEPFLPPAEVARRAVRRAAKLLGVLAGLAVAVYFFSKF
jgi:hypothetical protein